MARPCPPPLCPNSQSVATPVVRRERPNGAQRLQQGSLEGQPESGDQELPQQAPTSAQAGGGSSGGDVTGPQQMELCCGEQLEGATAAPAAPRQDSAAPAASPTRPPHLALLPPAEARTPPRPAARGQQHGAEPGTPSPGTYKFGSPIGSPLAHALGGLALGGSSAEPSPLTTPRCRPKPSAAAGGGRIPKAPAPNRAASPQSSANVPGQWRREASFADLLAPAQRAAANVVPAAAHLAAAAASQLAAEMATSPRKRARKSLAPARAANSSDEPMLDAAAVLAGGLRRQGSFQDDSELQALAHKPAERR
ncbi:hypothetical protein C2E21_6608 [Chlorella sorokiniana]|uniref:Uncharacterized protein n=1 Tax=Chlorella sorokiniana TaxID=3076 RepID=A0A2P6TKJ8_CHLSO|nr:hypothetical protein C2E21_6608 [Chlorella sorokiniana]|eukprot:PRW44596.1 hypothetical protein C2E21_6608 [Chlorella sorokiniana]